MHTKRRVGMNKVKSRNNVLESAPQRKGKNVANRHAPSAIRDLNAILINHNTIGIFEHTLSISIRSQHRYFHTLPHKKPAKIMD